MHMQLKKIFQIILLSVSISTVTHAASVRVFGTVMEHDVKIMANNIWVMRIAPEGLIEINSNIPQSVVVKEFISTINSLLDQRCNDGACECVWRGK